MISLIGGELYQWDTGRIVRIDPDENVTVHEVHFTTKRMEYAYVLKTYIEDGVTYCAIPNIILQQSYRLLCYEVCENSDGEETIANTSFNIIKRNRPEDYVYTEQEHFTFVKLENRVKSLEDKAHTHDNKTELDSITAEDLETWRNPNSTVVAGGAQVGTLFKDLEVTTTLAEDSSEWTGASSKPFKCTFRPSPGQTVYAIVGDLSNSLATPVNISPEGDSLTKTVIGNYSVVNSKLKTWYNDGDHNPPTPNSPDFDWCFVFDYDNDDSEWLTPDVPMCTFYSKVPGTYKVTVIAADYSIDPLSITSMYNVRPYTWAEYGTYSNWKDLTESGKYDIWEVAIKKTDYYNGVYLKEVSGTKYIYWYHTDQKENPDSGTFTNTEYTLTYDTATETVTCSDATLNPETDVIISVHRDQVVLSVPDKATSLGEATPDKVGKMLTAVDTGGTYNKWQNYRYQYRWVDAPTDSSKDALTYTEQTLTDEQKAQARTNIGIPEKITTEEYVNGQGFLKEHQSLEAYAKKTEIPTIPTKVSAFENDSGYLTEHQSLTDYAKKTDIPTVPTKISSFENDSGYLTEHQSLTDYAKKTDIAQPDWNQNDQTAKDYIKNRIGGYEANIDPITISWDGNTEGKIVVDDQLYLVSNETPTINQLIGGTIKYVIVKNGETTSENLTITEDVIGSYANGNIIIGEFCVIIHSPGTIGNATFKNSGIYFVGMFSETQTVYVNELTTVSGIAIVKIPEKYLDVATKDEVITAQTTANTAQTTANTAQTTANTAQTTANTAQTTANTAQTTADAVTNAVKKVIFSTASFTFDKVTSGRDTFRYNAFSYYKISDFNVSQTDVISFYGTRENGKELSRINVGNNCVEYGLFIIVASPGECSLNIREHTMNFTAPSAGLYACYEAGNNTVTAGTGIFTIASIPTNTVGIQSTGLNLQSLSSNLIKNYKVTIDDGSLCITDISDNTSKKLATEDYVTSQLKSLPVDGTTIKLNDQGQLTLALSNANGVSF